MLRAHWTPDFTEAHIVETMLRAHDVPAWVFDGGIVRQDWFKTLALGGYRVMVPDEHALRARELAWRYRCSACATTWRAPPGRTFADLARAVDAQTP